MWKRSWQSLFQLSQCRKIDTSAAPYDSNPDTDAGTGSHIDSDAPPTEKRQMLGSPKDAEDADDESENTVKSDVSFWDWVCKNKKKTETS